LDIADYFIESAFPTRDEAQGVLNALEEAPQGLSVPELLGRVNISRGRIEKTISLLSLESPAPIARQGTRWQLTAASLSEAFWARTERLTELRRGEQRQMQEYVSLTSGHMEYLIRALDGDPCAVGTLLLPPLPATLDPVLVREAVAYLRRANLPIDPRKQWPTGGMPKYGLSGRIAPELQAEPGRALCVWGDAGWGGLVRRGKYHDGRFSNELVAACAAMVREWDPHPSPTWVTCVPSLRRPGLVPGFARRLAMSLGLPFSSILKRTEDRPEQKAMANSVQQARNVDGSLAAAAPPLPAGPVFVVDDMVDSRWTMTVAA